MRKLHPSITHDRVLEAAMLSFGGDEYPGFCIECGAEHDGIDPDAEDYPCEDCDTHAVFGAEQLILLYR